MAAKGRQGSSRNWRGAECFYCDARAVPRVRCESCDRRCCVDHMFADRRCRQHSRINETWRQQDDRLRARAVTLVKEMDAPHPEDPKKTHDMLCRGCGYSGDNVHDFGTTENAGERFCPICGSHDCHMIDSENPGHTPGPR